MLPAAGPLFTIQKVQAESLTDFQSRSELPKVMQSATLTTSDQEIPNLQAYTLSINDQMIRVSNAIQANNLEINKIKTHSKQLKAEVKQLKKEIGSLKKEMDKRKSVLRDRARSYQQSNQHVTYLDVLLDATSFSDFVERVGAVAAIAEADQNLLELQETQQHEYDNKKLLLENKITDLANKKNTLEKLRDHLKKQEKEYAKVKEQLKKEIRKAEAKKKETRKKENDQPYISVTSNNGKDYISTVINAGNKYIGNSVYVFGGGRNAADIASGRFDCSGFVHWAFAQAGIKIGSTTSTIKNDGRQVSTDDMQPGDLVFFNTYKKDGHVGIYLGNGKFIGSQSSTGVAIADMTSGYWKKTFNGRVVRI